jgi:subtilisin family serine protease
VVELADVADLSGARAVDRWEDRGAWVLDALRQRARTTNQRVLDAVARTAGARVTPFWIRNSVVVEGAPAALRAELERLPGVRQVREERTFAIDRPVMHRLATTAPAGQPEWGVGKVGAPRAWERGVTGTGIVVGSIDSGVDYLHPAITNQYRGNLGGGTFDHNYNWFDAAHVCPGTDPCDLGGHGTHVMGTILGGDGPGAFSPDPGVAPGATWISAGCGPFFCSESQILAAAQFMLAPFGDAQHPADPSRRPDVINNSWGIEPGGDAFAVDLVRAWRAAGIVPVFSSGNSGPDCATAASPADYGEALAVGATGPDDLIAESSSRGPAAGGRAKPDVSAPGVDVVSSVPGGEYEAMSGTSSAAPHVAGALALALSATPAASLDVDHAIDAVVRTAVDRADTTCGGDADGDPNNVYGEGRIDADAAVARVANGGTLTGRVTAQADGAPLTGARVTAVGGGRRYSTAMRSDGTYRLLLPTGRYEVAVTSFGSTTATRAALAVARDRTITLDVALAPAPAFAVGGTILSAETGTALAGARVEVLGAPRAAVADDAGRYGLSLPTGRYRLRASRGGCVAPRTFDVTVAGGGPAVVADTELEAKTDRFGHGCAPVAYGWTEAHQATGLVGNDEYGKLRLPFAMPWFGTNYRDLYVATDGILSFTDPYYTSGWNEPIPAEWGPNAAIYPLWEDLSVEGAATITWESLGSGADARVVVAYNGVRVAGTDRTVTFEVVLRANGSVDVVYADTAGVDEGAHATIGIESPDGRDGLAFGFKEKVAPSGSAWRYRAATTGPVRGTVVDANDGQALAGATVTADPGGRTATTDRLGRYQLDLIPGRYRLGITARDYAPAEVAVSARDGVATANGTTRLRTGVATVTPGALRLTTPAGQTREQTVTLRNTGTAPLSWSAVDRTDVPAPTPRGTPAPRRTIVSDPAGDYVGGPVDVVDVSASATAQVLSMAITFSADTVMDNALGLVLVDSDGNPATGVPADTVGGRADHDIGVDYLINVTDLHFEGPKVAILRAGTFQQVGTAPGRIEGRSMIFDVPTGRFGLGEDGNMDVVFMAAYPTGPVDWAPAAGHATVEVRADAPWIEETPDHGVLAPGESVPVIVRAGSPTLSTGSHQADVRFTTDAARARRREVAVTVRVT